MSNNSFLNELDAALNCLKQDFNMPHLSFDQNHRCQLKFNDQFDLEFIGNPSGGIQFHAYITRFNTTTATSGLTRTLLAMNAENSSVFGGYLGLDEKLGYISFNLVVTLKEITPSELMNLINNFIDAAVKTKELLSKEMDSKPNNTATNTAPNPSNQESMMFLSGRV